MDTMRDRAKKPNLINYTPTKVWKTFASRSARYCVFDPIFDGEWSPTDVPDALRRVRELWHSRLYSLNAYGWGPLSREKAMAYALNCPPFGVSTRSSGVACNRPLICPFCWARRYVFPAYNALVPYAGKYALLEFTTRRKMRTKHGPSGLRIPIDSMFRFKASLFARDMLRSYRSFEVKASGACGGVVVHSVDFSKKSWTFVRSGLLLVDPERVSQTDITTAKDDATIRRHWAVHASFDKKLLSACVGRRMRFPAGALTTPNAADVVSLMQTIRGTRMSARYGILRGSKNHF